MNVTGDDPERRTPLKDDFISYISQKRACHAMQSPGKAPDSIREQGSGKQDQNLVVFSVRKVETRAGSSLGLAHLNSVGRLWVMDISCLYLALG